MSLRQEVLELKIQALEEIISEGLDPEDEFNAMLQFYKIELSDLERGN